MCIFCAAIPTALAIGVSAKSQQDQARETAKAQGERPTKPIIPAGPATAVVVVSLVTASVWVHTRFPELIF